MKSTPQYDLTPDYSIRLRMLFLRTTAMKDFYKCLEYDELDNGLKLFNKWKLDEKFKLKVQVICCLVLHSKCPFV